MSISMALLVVGVGVAAGFLAGLFGVGGGVIMVPFLVLVLDETQHVAEGTSLAVIVPTALVGVAVHIKSHNVDLSVGGLMGLGGVAGALLGATLALALSAPTLQRIFAIVVALIGAHYVRQGLRAAPEDGPDPSHPR